MKEEYFNELIKSYITIFFKIQENYNRIKRLEEEKNNSSEEYELYKSVLTEQSFYEDNIINEIYDKIISPNLIDYEDININIYILVEQISMILEDNLKEKELEIIKARLEKELIRIFNSKEQEYGNMDKKKKFNHFINKAYSEEEKEIFSNKDLYDMFNTISFYTDTTNIHTILFLDQEIKKATNEILRNKLIEMKYDFISMDRKSEKSILINNKKSFNFDFTNEDFKNTDKDKIDNIKEGFALKTLSVTVNALFMLNSYIDDEIEYQAHIILNKCTLRAVLLMLNEKQITEELADIKENFETIAFEYINEFNKEMSAVIEVFKRSKLDKGFARNLRII